MSGLDPLGLVTGVTDLAEKLGYLDKVKRKLMRQPDPAAAKLATALVEIYKIYEALDTAITQYLSLWIDEKNEELNRERPILLSLEGGRIQAQMREAKGSCTKIGNIYKVYLHPWFDRVLDREEADQLASLFRELEDWDSEMIGTINAVAAWLVSEASKVRPLFDAGEYEAASQRVQKAADLIKPVRQQLSKSMSTLFDLQDDFIGLSGAV